MFIISRGRGKFKSWLQLATIPWITIGGEIVTNWHELARHSPPGGRFFLKGVNPAPYGRNRDTCDCNGEIWLYYARFYIRALVIYSKKLAILQ